jgi:hypothetical protein
MPAAETMVLAWLGFALHCVAVGNFSFCHLGEETILAFARVMKTLETQRNGGNGVFEDLVLLEFL